jgi:hypothetical protein
MIDVNKITSTLAKLPDQQLQQYAQMHKSDPYIMALAMSESNRRKEMRSAGQAAQGGQEQPKVVDQMVAEMAPQQLPEEMGIGQLPAGDMNFADGGIVAFADGGDVERYQVGGMMGDIPGFVAGTGNLIPQQGAPEEVPLFRRMFRDARAVGANYQVEQAKARIAAGVGTSADEAILAAAQPVQNAGPSPQDMAQFDAASNLYMTERAAKQAAAAPKKETPPPAPTGRKGPGAPGAAPAAGKPAAVGFREQYLKDLEGMAPEKTKTLEEIRAERAALMPKEKAYAGLEAALNKETEGAAGEKQDAIWMAVTQAGLAAAAGTSTSALKNIADGFGTGLAGYKESLKEFKKADKERQKAMADIEQARRAEARGDVDAAIGLREKSQERMDKYNDRKAAGLAAITGSEISAAASKYSADTSAAASRAAANRTPAELQLIERYGSDPKFAAAYDKFAQAKREPQTQETLMKAWSSNMLLQQQYPNPQDYIKMMAGSSADAGTGGFKVVGVRNP